MSATLSGVHITESAFTRGTARSPERRGATSGRGRPADSPPTRRAGRQPVAGAGPGGRLTTNKEGRAANSPAPTRDRDGNTGYTSSVKTAISVPDPLFHEAEQLARRLGWSRSQLYTQAVRELISRQGDDPVTTALNDLAAEMGAETPPSAGRALIQAGAWEW